MEEVRYTSAGKWLEALRQRQGEGHEVMAEADPMRRVLGFIDHTEDKVHLISITHLKATRSEVPLQVMTALLEPGGRQQLVTGG